MKTLIKNSIRIYGMGHPDTKTVFHLQDATLPLNSTEEEIKNSQEKETQNQKILKDFRFQSLVRISGRKLSVGFSYNEEGKRVEDKLQLNIPVSDKEEEIRDFILDAINEKIEHDSSDIR